MQKIHCYTMDYAASCLGIHRNTILKMIQRDELKPVLNENGRAVGIEPRSLRAAWNRKGRSRKGRLALTPITPEERAALEADVDLEQAMKEFEANVEAYKAEREAAL